MVSNARLDLPEPERPVTTMRRSRGSSTEMFRRLWTRAPWTAIVVRAALFGVCRCGAALWDMWPSRVEERQFLDGDVALLRQADRRRGLADESLIREILARRRHAAYVEVA